jgi:hypothetical protein
MERYGLSAQDAGIAPSQVARKLGLVAPLEIRRRWHRLLDNVRLDQWRLPVAVLRAEQRIGLTLLAAGGFSLFGLVYALTR